MSTITINTETWNVLPGTDGTYWVSSLGRVRSFKSDSGEGKLLKTSMNKGRYLKCKIYVNGGVYTRPIHKLMQIAFNMGEGHIDHVNGVRSDNRLENLRIATTRENAQNLERHRQGYLVGATKVNKTGRYQSRIRVDDSLIYLGTFDTELDAHLRYREACNILEMLGKH